MLYSPLLKIRQAATAYKKVLAEFLKDSGLVDRIHRLTFAAENETVEGNGRRSLFICTWLRCLQA